MRTAIRHIVARTYRPLLVRYLSRTRVYRYKDIRLDIPPEVFHPGFFFSTQLLLQYVLKLPLSGKKFLELGCGSGLISIAAAKKGALVTGSDINPIAIEYLKRNSSRNKTVVEAVGSDLFKGLAGRKFDIIAINPPYYKKQPGTVKDHAWFCGENGEYFLNLFSTIGDHIYSETEILMALFEGCDFDMITGYAENNGFLLQCVHSKTNMLEKNFIYKIEKKK